MFSRPSPKKGTDTYLTTGGLNSTRSSSLNSNNTNKSKSAYISSLDLNSIRPPCKRFFNDRSVLYEIKEEKKAIIGLTPEAVLQAHKNKLTPLECAEILSYPEIFYIGNAIKKHNGVYDDEKGYYRAFVSDHIAYRYEILHILGDGSFGIVINCFDHKLQTPVAIKILRTGPQFDQNGKTEAQTLDILSSGTCHDTIIEKFSEFEFRNHFCIVFELLNQDLYQFMKQRHFQGLALNVLRRVAVQLVLGLKHIHDSGLIHCDLKPENILFKMLQKSTVKIIDFGSACKKEDRGFTYIQSRFYRAPEILMELDYSGEIDFWSLGCILVELYTGWPLFMGDDEEDQLCKIVETLGDIPEGMIRRSPRREELFDASGRLRRGNELKVMPGRNRISMQLKKADSSFVDFVGECLRIDPAKRIDAKAALRHPWIKGNALKNVRSSRVLYNSMTIF